MSIEPSFLRRMLRGSFFDGLRSIGSAYVEERNLRSEYRRWLLEQIRLSGDVGVDGDAEVINKNAHYRALLDAPREMQPSNIVWRSIRFGFLSLCFVVVAWFVYRHVAEASVAVDAETREFAIVLSENWTLLKPRRLNGISIDGVVTVNDESVADSSLAERADDGATLSLQSIDGAAGTEVTVAWMEGRLYIDVGLDRSRGENRSGGPIENTGGTVTLTRRDSSDSMPTAIDVKLATFASIVLETVDEQPPALNLPLGIDRLRTLEQVAASAPVSTLYAGELLFYRNRVQRRLSAVDLLDIEAAPPPGALQLYRVEFSEGGRSRFFVSGVAMRVSGGSDGQRNLMPTLKERWEGNAALAAIIGGGLLLFSTLRAVFG